LALEWWLRDVWLHTLDGQQSTACGPQSTVQSPRWEGEPAGAGLDSGGTRAAPVATREGLLVFPQLAGTQRVARRLSSKAALENLRIIEQLQRWLHTNVQEALALEVGLLKLQL
jgi:hypothetical protein